jgi:hypothetical protein
MDSRHRTRVGIDFGWRAGSPLVLLALVFAVAAAPAPAADDLVPDSIPREGAFLEDLDAHPRREDERLRLRLAW